MKIFTLFAQRFSFVVVDDDGDDDYDDDGGDNDLFRGIVDRGRARRVLFTIIFVKTRIHRIMVYVW